MTDSAEAHAVPHVPALPETPGARLHWWITSGMLTILILGGGAWAAHVEARITALDDTVRKELPALFRELIKDHENRPHRDAVHVREMTDLKHRLERIETKIDNLRTP